MSAVCNWMSLFLCLRSAPKKTAYHQVHPNLKTYDAVIVWKGKESPKAKAGGVAYDVILKPATNTIPPVVCSSPPKRECSEDEIFDKLKKAQERRESLEAMRQEQLARGKAKATEVAIKAAVESEEFVKQTKEKLRRSMEINKENREALLKAREEKLKCHLQKVEEVCRQSDAEAKALEEKINQKIEIYEENRQTVLNAMLERLREHASHIKAVCQASENMGKINEDKYQQKMNAALKNREMQIAALQERLREHERRIDEVRKNKQVMQTSATAAE